MIFNIENCHWLYSQNTMIFFEYYADFWPKYVFFNSKTEMKLVHMARRPSKSSVEC